MKVRYRKEMANHSGPESCSDFREGVAEALTGETDGPAIEPRNQESGMPTSLSETEGNTRQANVNIRFENVARIFHQHLSARLVDLLEIASYVYSADCATSRGKGWTDDERAVGARLCFCHSCKGAWLLEFSRNQLFDDRSAEFSVERQVFLHFRAPGARPLISTTILRVR